VISANAVKNLVQGNVGGFDQIWGPWNPYRTSSELRLMHFVNKLPPGQ